MKSPPPLNIRLAALLALAVAAYVVPRAVELSGVSTLVGLHFGDGAKHLSNLERLHRLPLLSGEAAADPFFEANRGAFRFNQAGWPAGVYCLADIWYGWFEPQSPWVSLLTNGAFALVLMIGLAGLGRAMGSTQAGLWAAVLVALCPGLAGGTLFFNLDFPLAAMTTVGLLLLWRTAGFMRLGGCLAFGLWCGLGMSVKMGYPIFLAGPVLWALAASLVRRRPRALAGVVLSGLLALGVAWIVGGLPLVRIWSELTSHVAPPPGAYPAANLTRWTWEWLFALPKFVAAAYPAPLALLALPGLILWHRPARHGSAASRQAPPSVQALMVASIWGALLFFQVMDNKMERYLHPLYPLLCLATTWWVATRPWRRFRTAALGGVAAAYAVTLALVYLAWPAPWVLDPGAESSRAFLYDLRVPGRESLLGQRADPGSPVSSLVREMTALARLEPGRRPMGVVTPHRNAPRLLPVGGKGLVEIAALVTARRLDDRYLAAVDQELSEPMPPVLLLVRVQGEAPGPVVSGYRREAGRRLKIDDLNLVVELYVQRQG